MNSFDINERKVDHPLPKKVSQILTQMRPISYEIIKDQNLSEKREVTKAKTFNIGRMLTNEIIDRIFL